ncbi:MAG: energy transducer TonB [Bacteroidetes bacterium]|nr:energy transducer TonB [Bacteroidota bacterium]MCL2302202.1 energy transducer TonB [Lentimicrobiaceae bacterium]MCL2302282.1 energy transducer TonB [Lentimicrobiaceae bacterium]
MIRQILLTIGLLVITICVFSQSKLTPKQIAKRNYQEVVADRIIYRDTIEPDKYLTYLLRDRIAFIDTIVPDKFPMYPGGVQGILDDLSKNMFYPQDAASLGIEGTVILQFVVEEDGTIREIEILKGVDPKLDAEAIRVIKKLDIWVPGHLNGKPVRLSYVQPIIFHVLRETSGLALNFKSARSKITWVGENNEHLNISNKTASLQKGMNFQQFKVVKYAKNNHIILSQTQHGAKFKQKYNIVHATKDTLILAPEGEDIFVLGETNEHNQYVFVNSMLTYNFVELYYEALFHHNNFVSPKVSLKVILYIDSAKNSQVVVQNEISNEINTYTTPLSKVEYKRLMQILSSCDIGCFQNEDRMIDEKTSYSILEIKYNDQIKTFNGFTHLPLNFADELADFICDYIESRANIAARWGWRIWIRRR